MLPNGPTHRYVKTARRRLCGRPAARTEGHVHWPSVAVCVLAAVAATASDEIRGAEAKQAQCRGSGTGEPTSTAMLSIP